MRCFAVASLGDTSTWGARWRVVAAVTSGGDMKLGAASGLVAGQ
ncbi:hypothetical protein [Mycobacterium lacus]|nr:hypothetical protein [Mycobacterium lacus]